MSKNYMPINPVVLKWARESGGFTLGDISNQQGFSKFPEWESGKILPTYTQLENIAEKLHRPVALFFFPEPPEEEKIERSLRVIDEKDIQIFSPSIRLLFRKAKAFQISLKELWVQEIDEHKKKIQWISLLKSSDVSTLAKETRKLFGISVAEQKSWKNSDKALKKWRYALADKGLYVFKDAFQNKMIAGFCLYDDLFPIIFINNSMSKNRQIFTLAHELAHIVLKESYLDIFDEKFWQLESEQPSHIEAKCNAFAAEFLIPEEDFKAVVSKQFIAEDTITKLAENYCVSKEVILRSCLTHQFIDKNFYHSKIMEWCKNFAPERMNTLEKTLSGGGNYYNKKMDYLGDAYLALVLKNFDQGRIALEEAALHLDVKMKAVPVIEEKFLTRKIPNVRI
ncbi:MAG: ImmA/IrrE family metallo-endopeptidase [Planctomycetota bacterium]